VWAGYSGGIGVLFGHVLGGQPLLATVIGIATAVSIGFVADLIASRALRTRDVNRVVAAR
jgi:hypothetical protein